MVGTIRDESETEAQCLRLHARALEMASHYSERGDVLSEAHWHGQAMAYALLLRDQCDYVDADALIDAIPVP